MDFELPLTSVLTSTTVHLMQTRSKSGMSKPKQLLSLFATLAKPELTFLTQVSKHSHWKAAIAEEYITLLADGIWVLVPTPPVMKLGREYMGL